MSKEVDNIVPFPGKAEPVIEPTMPSPHYVVEEEDDEEETMTIDFDANKVYSQEDSWVLRDTKTKEIILSGGSVKAEQIFRDDIAEAKSHIVSTGELTTVDLGPAVPEKAPGEEFKEELQDIFMNSLVSKAIASMLSQYHELDNKIDDAISVHNMGDLNYLISDGIDQVMEARRKELRACYNGATVRYENIPDWAKSYVRDYVRERVMEISMLSRF